MAKVKLREDTTEAWLKQRLGSIGSSDAGAVVGLNPWKSNVDVYLEKIAEDPEDEETIDTRLGTKMEAPIAEIFAEDTGYELEEDPYIRYHEEYEFLSCNIDRIVVDEGVPAEIKMKSRFSGEIPDYEFCQIQQQMFILDVEYCYYIVLVTGFNRRLEHEVFTRNDQFIEAMVQEEAAFWDHVERRVPPQPKTYNQAKKLFTGVSDQVIQATDQQFNFVRRAADTHERIKHLEGKLDQMKGQIGWMLQDPDHPGDENAASEVLQYRGEDIVTWRKSNPSTKFDKRAFRKDNPDLYREYCTERPGYRRMLFKKDTIEELHQQLIEE